jgi:uncharacterized protein
MEYRKRDLENIISDWIFRNKILIILGARQVGKTTLVKELLKKFDVSKNYYNCELLSVKSILETKDPYKIKNFIGDSKLVVFDEAQKINDIGLVLKLLFDTFPEVQIIATGSSSFELKNKTNESLTGRALDFHLYPFSIHETKQFLSNVELYSSLEKFLRFGLYPEIMENDENRAKILLENLISRYLYKDILEFESLKKPDLIVKLLQLLAFQVGSEVSLNELSVKLGVTRATIERYLDLLEKSYVIFRLKAFKRNLRSEISKKVKIYFYDLGIRNSIISQYNSITLRNDIGALWENFCILELIKDTFNKGIRKNFYFWRNTIGNEIDLIEDYNGELNAYEFKWKNIKTKIPLDFTEVYKNVNFKIITSDNFLEYL